MFFHINKNIKFKKFIFIIYYNIYNKNKKNEKY